MSNSTTEEAPELPESIAIYFVCIQYFLIIMSILNCLLMAGICYIHLLCHNSFHPLFSSLYLTAMLAYFFDSFTLLICVGLDFIPYTEFLGHVFDICSLIERCCYYYVTPILLILLIERTCATFFVATYEYSSGWKFNFIVAQMITVFCVALLCYFEMEMNNLVQNLWSWLLLFFYFVMYLALFVLLTMNRHKILSLQTEKVTLTLRYQLAENVKTIRMLSIYIFFDTAITLADLSVSIPYGSQGDFDEERSNDAVYILLMGAATIASCLLENILPVVLLYTTNAYLHKFHRLLDPGFHEKATGLAYAKVKVHQTSPTPNKQSTKLRNVLGAEIVMQQDTERYFETLKQMWN